MEITIDVANDEDEFDWGNHVMNVGSMVVPGFYTKHFGAGKSLIKGADDAMVEFYAAGSNFWMDTITK